MTIWVTTRKHFHSHEKALEIRKNTLPPNHPDFADFIQQHWFGI